MQQSSYFHDSVHCANAHLHTTMPKYGVHPADTIVVIVLMFSKNAIDLDQKKLLFVNLL